MCIRVRTVTVLLDADRHPKAALSGARQRETELRMENVYILWTGDGTFRWLSTAFFSSSFAATRAFSAHGIVTGLGPSIQEAAVRGYVSVHPN